MNHRSLVMPVFLVALAATLALALAGCGGGDEVPESTYMPVNCGQPGACL